MLGLVVPDITNPFFAELAHAVEGAAAEQRLPRHPRQLRRPGGRRARARRRPHRAQRGRTAGLHRPDCRAALAALLPRPQRPTVLLNVSSPFAGYAAIGADARQGAYDVVDHLLGAHGHTSVVLVIGESTERLPEPRERGFADAFAAHGLPPGPVVRTDLQPDGRLRRRRVRSWAGGTGPTAIFLSSDQQAAGAYRALREAGLECPDDVALVAYDGTTESEFGWPPLTVSRQPVERWPGPPCRPCSTRPTPRTTSSSRPTS